MTQEVTSNQPAERSFKIPLINVRIPIKKVPLGIAAMMTLMLVFRYTINPMRREMRSKTSEKFANDLYEAELMRDELKTN